MGRAKDAFWLSDLGNKTKKTLARESFVKKDDELVEDKECRAR